MAPFECPKCFADVGSIFTERRPDGNHKCSRCGHTWPQKAVCASDCAKHREPAQPAGPCSCGAEKGMTPDQAKLDHAFKYHAPKPGQPEKYTALRDKAKELAFLIDELCPNSREKSLAITNLEQAVMWANASIARN